MPAQGTKLAKLLKGPGRKDGMVFTPPAPTATLPTATPPTATPPTVAADFGNQMAEMLNGVGPS